MAADPLFGGLFPPIGPWTAAALWHGAHDYPVPSTPIEPELPVIVRQRLAPLLLRYLRSTSAPQLEMLRRQLESAALQLASRSIEILNHGAQISADLRAAGIPNAAVKGPAIAAIYPSAQDRPYVDLDLYLAPDQFESAVRLCREWGLQEDEASRQPRRYFDRLCREAVNLRSPSGASVDLHHHVPPWLWGHRLLATDLIARARPVTLLGRGLSCATAEDNLLIAALHVVSDKNHPGGTLLIWRDLVQLAGVVDIDLAVRRAAESGLAGWLRGVLAQLPSAVRPERLIQVLDPVADPPPHRRRLRMLMFGRGASAGVIVTQSLRLPVPRAGIFAAGMVFPSREFLHRNFPGEPHPLASWWKAVVGRRDHRGWQGAADRLEGQLGRDR